MFIKEKKIKRHFCINLSDNYLQQNHIFYLKKIFHLKTPNIQKKYYRKKVK